MRKVSPSPNVTATIDALLSRASLGDLESIRHLNTLCYPRLLEKARVLTALAFRPDPGNPVEWRIASRLRGRTLEARRDAADIAVGDALVYMAAPCRRAARDARDEAAADARRRTNWMLVRPGTSPVYFLGGVLKHKLAEALADELAPAEGQPLDSEGRVVGADGEGVAVQPAASWPGQDRRLMAARALEALPAALRAMPPTLRQAGEELVAEHVGATRRTRPLSNAEMVARSRARLLLAEFLEAHLGDGPHVLGLPGVVAI